MFYYNGENVIPTSGLAAIKSTMMLVQGEVKMTINGVLIVLDVLLYGARPNRTENTSLCVFVGLWFWENPIVRKISSWFDAQQQSGLFPSTSQRNHQAAFSTENLLMSLCPDLLMFKESLFIESLVQRPVIPTKCFLDYPSSPKNPRFGFM